MAIPERYRWAVDILDIQPDDMILEVGCGYGHSIPLICEKLATGHLTVIDRSEKMIAAASRANARFISNGCVDILHQDLLERRLPRANCDKIFLFNINVFWMDPVDELTEIRRLLKLDGQFFLFHHPPPGHTLEEFIVEFEKNLVSNGFQILDSTRNELDPIRALYIKSVHSPERGSQH